MAGTPRAAAPGKSAPSERKTLQVIDLSSLPHTPPASLTSHTLQDRSQGNHRHSRQPHHSFNPWEFALKLKTANQGAMIIDLEDRMEMISMLTEKKGGGEEGPGKGNKRQRTA